MPRRWDYESTDLESAAYLAREMDPPWPEERPSRQELREFELEMQRRARDLEDGS